MAEFEVRILCPSKVVLIQKSSYLRVPGLEGELGILPGHAQMISEIGVGILALDAQDKDLFFVSGGYVDVQGDKVVVLADVVERPGDIDRERAKKAALRAQQRLNTPTEDLDWARAMGALARATKRLDIGNNP